jgi:threonine aldolase
MISFENDYNNGAHPKILEALVKCNDVRTTPYGYDVFTEQAQKKIMEACEDPDAQIYFLAGGTQTNATVVDSLLYQYEGVIAVETGHINVHEAGAIEFTEHKIITIPGNCGKMEAATLNGFLNDFMHDGNNAHSVFPGLVYITFPTELGTLYTAQELDDIYKVCKHYNIPLYVDGARLGYGLMSPQSDITLPYLAHHCDVFYIGGTKIGALCGEAVVFTHHNAHKHFFSIQKQHGAVMAKGRLNGVQFMTLFTDNLYFEIARNAIDMAMQMKEIFLKKGYKFFIDSPTNQQFVIIPNKEVERLQSQLEFTHWSQYGDDEMVCRFVTSWATTQEEIDTLRKVILEQ